MIVPYPSGSPRPLEAGGPVLTSPSWFPDNRHVAVAVRIGDGTVLSIVDTADGTRRTIASAPNGFPEPSVSPEGKRIAYAAGQFGWDVLEISLPEGQVRTLISGGISRTPDWAPSGTLHLFDSSSRRRIVPRGGWISLRPLNSLPLRGHLSSPDPDYLYYPGLAWNVLVAGRAMDLLLARALRETGPGKSPRYARVCPGGCGERQASDLGRLDAPMVARGRLDRVSGRGWHRFDFAGWQIHAQPDFTQIPGLWVLEGRQPVLRRLPKHHRQRRAVAALFDEREVGRGKASRAH